MRLVSTGNPASTACAVSAASTALTVPPVLCPLSHRSCRERTKERSQGGPRDEEGQQEDGAGGDAEGVVADEAGLDDAEAGAAGPHDGGHTVDEAVDASFVEGGGAVGHRLDRAVDGGGEALVDVPGVLEHRGLDLLGRHPVAEVDLPGGEDAEDRPH